MNYGDLVWVGLAGGAGALARFVVDGTIRRRWAGRVPVATIAINVTGSFLLGVLTALVVHHGAPRQVTLVGGTGFCGGYTTFSTASWETVRLLQQGHRRAAVVSGGGTLVAAWAAAAAGLALAGR